MEKDLIGPLTPALSPIPRIRQHEAAEFGEPTSFSHSNGFGGDRKKQTPQWQGLRILKKKVS
jgi:hypothetical protein